MTMKYYHQLNELQTRYRSNGFTILGFPCNQFFRQEPGTCPAIKEFLQENGIDFQVFDKIDVNGDEADELFKYLRSNSRLESTRIGWNFGKFLISRDGKIHDYYGPRTEPLEVVPDIEKLL